MCTAINLRKRNHYFGRNLDLEYHYNEEVVISPQNFNFPFRNISFRNDPYPMIGMATVIDGVPLYYDATNIHGLSMAGLNFPGNAVYHPIKEGTDNVASFELIPWILVQCRTVQEARTLLSRINITDTIFSKDFPPTPLHWIISDQKESIAVESEAEGVSVYDNPIDVLTNTPPFPYHMYNLCNYLNLTNNAPTGDLIKSLNLHPYSNGMGGIGLPGDLSSASRFVRAAFMLASSDCEDTESDCVSQFFHVLDTVAHPRGSVIVNKKYEITYYSSCCNTQKGIYYYKTYGNSRITAVDMYNEDLTQFSLIRYPLQTAQDIYVEND